MAVKKNTVELSRGDAQEWISDRGIDRLPQKDETLEYIPAGTFNQYDLVRAGSGFALTSHVLG